MTYGLVIVHEDGATLSTSVPEDEAWHRFEEARKERSVAYAHVSDPNYHLACYTRDSK